MQLDVPGKSLDPWSQQMDVNVPRSGGLSRWSSGDLAAGIDSAAEVVTRKDALRSWLVMIAVKRNVQRCDL